MRRSRLIFVGLAVTIGAVGLVLRVWQLGESLWLDELHTAWCVTTGWSEIAERALIGNQSPLYFYVPRLATSLLGTTEWTLRLPSLLAGMLLLAVIGGLVWSWTK